MDDIVRAMWKGGNGPTTFPHICPYRLEGADEKACIGLSGSSFRVNVDGCCGTFRGTVMFAPCNSVVRRCRVCLEKGRSGLKANAVTNVAEGTCDEHARGQSDASPQTKRLSSEALLF